MIEIDKKKLLDVQGNPQTQSLFLEIGYSDYALYTLKDEDHTYKRTLFPSLKKLFLEMEDPTEYLFANKYLLGWKHWKRLNANKALSPYFDEWREELELKIRAQSIRDVIQMSAEDAQGSFQAAKWLADKGWDKRTAGRPSKAEAEKEKRMAERIADEFNADILRMEDFVNKGK